MSKKPRLLLLVPAVLLFLLAVLVSREWEAPALGRAVLSRAAGLAGVDLRVESVRFHVLEGIRLRGVRARLDSPGGELEADMERLELRHRLGPLLGGRIEIDELRLVRPTLRLRRPSAEPGDRSVGGPGAGPGPAPPAAGASDPGDGPVLAISRIVVDGASLTLEAPEEGAAPTRLEGLDLELRDLALDAEAPSVAVGLRGRGRLGAERIEADPLVGTDLRSELEIAEGRVTLTGLELDAAEGPVAAEALVVDLRREPWSFELRDASVVPIALASILGATGESFGRAELRVDVTGVAETLGLDGRGRVSVAEGTLPSIPIVATLEALVGTTAISGSPYEAFELPFLLSGTRLDLEPTEIVTPDLRIGLAGGADLEGEVDLRVTVRFPRGALDVEEIPEALLDLMTDAEGLVNVHAAFAGPIEAPRAKLDRSGWKKTAREALEREARTELEKGAAKLLGKLLGGGDDEDEDPD